jgi:hypothetical protein
MKIYMFRTVRLSIIRSLFTVHSAMVYVIQVCRQLSSRTIRPQLLCPAVSRQINSSAWQVSLWQVVVYHRQTGAANRYQRRHSSWGIKGSLSLSLSLTHTHTHTHTNTGWLLSTSHESHPFTSSVLYVSLVRLISSREFSFFLKTSSVQLRDEPNLRLWYKGVQHTI